MTLVGLLWAVVFDAMLHTMKMAEKLRQILSRVTNSSDTA